MNKAPIAGAVLGTTAGGSDLRAGDAERKRKDSEDRSRVVGYTIAILC